jgi:hypothetical protein
MAQPKHIFIEKIKILKHKKHQAGRYYADDEVGLSIFGFSVFNPNSGCIINNNGGEQNENVLRNEAHIEKTTGSQQMQPPEPMRQAIENERNNGKEYQKFDRIE